MPHVFHSRVGGFVTLSNNNRTAHREHPMQEFNNGVILSAEPLRDNELFEVKIDRKVSSWSGSLEIGVTSTDPSTVSLPASATGLRASTWLLSGCSVLRDGRTLTETYGRDLDTLREGERAGVMRTADGALHFYVNGVDQGAAVESGIPSGVHAVVDLYGKCAQVTVVQADMCDESAESAVVCESTLVSNKVMNGSIAEASTMQLNQERLTFHERCGSLVRLTNGRRTAERRRPLDEFNNGVVMTNRPLNEDEMFEIRLDCLVDKWSGSIEVGITTHNPSLLDFPATMTNMRSGTIMMSGCGILTNGKGTRREYGEYNLDELQEGDCIGLMKKTGGVLHYYINGLDQGIAATKTPDVVWGVVDLYGMAVKVTIVDGKDSMEPHGGSHSGSLAGHRYNVYLQQLQQRPAQPSQPVQLPDTSDDDEALDQMLVADRLLFHATCGSHAAVSSSQRTAFRPNAADDFNNGVVLTNRPLRANELFEVRLDKMVDKWAGSVEIGVTTHLPTSLDFPSTMTNVRSGTWMMTGNGIMHNGLTVVEEYGQTLDSLKVNDRVGVVRREDGSLHFTVNGRDQGLAATSVPGNVYGVIDLYGQAAQATIIDHTDTLSVSELSLSVESAVQTTDSSPDNLRFHPLHGRNAVLTHNGRTAYRPNARAEFNDAIIVSNRPLRDNELFEVVIEKMVTRWSGSIEAGVTLIAPEHLDFPTTMTDIARDTWMLSGSAVMQNGTMTRSRYNFDLDALTLRSRVGMVRWSDGTLHFLLDGVDQGVACSNVPSGVYAVIDLYGQCAQVSITSGSGVQPISNAISADEVIDLSPACPAEASHCFSRCCGRNVALTNDGVTATRTTHFLDGLVFSAEPLHADEIFEIRVERVCKLWEGSLQVGLTTMAISDTTPSALLPPMGSLLVSKPTWVIAGSDVRKNGMVIKQNYTSSLQRLEVNDCVGVKRGSDGTMHLHINGQDVGIAATNIPKNVFALIDVYGRVESVSITSSSQSDGSVIVSPCHAHNINLQRLDTVTTSTEMNVSTEKLASGASSSNGHQEFDAAIHGDNITVSNANRTARRTAGYNAGVVMSRTPLVRNRLFQVCIDHLSGGWSSSLGIGVVSATPNHLILPPSALNINKPCWMVYGQAVFYCADKTQRQFTIDLDQLVAGQMVGVMLTDDGSVRLYLDGNDCGVIVLPSDTYDTLHVIVDLYGQCDQVTVASSGGVPPTTGTVDGGSVASEQREKADKEEGVKEKNGDNASKSCDYQNMCSLLTTTLGLPQGYLNSHGNRCYCVNCHKSRGGGEAYSRSGEPAREYSLPIGWCRFGLRLPHSKSSSAVDKWHVAYHGSHIGNVRSILDAAHLIIPGAHGGGGDSSLAIGADIKSTEESSDGEQVMLSPSIHYAGSQTFATRHQYHDPRTHKLHSVAIVFEVSVKPGSYKVDPARSVNKTCSGTAGSGLTANDRLDARFSNAELEWSTKERGATVLRALHVKIE